MNFVINLDPDRPPVGVVRTLSVRSSKGSQYKLVDADLHYIEYRYDRDSGKDFVCLIYRLPLGPAT